MLQVVCENIWCAHDGMFMPGGLMHFQLRMTVVRLSNGGLMLISPVAINEALAAELAELGPVAHIVAPNAFHHLHAGTAKARYPQARLYGVKGLDRKRKDLSFDEILDGDTPSAWCDELQQQQVDGASMMNEVVFFHTASKTLIVTDLVFNVHETKGLLTGLVLRLAGAYKCCSQSRIWRLLTKDKAAAGASARKILSWKPTRLIMAHGEILEQNVQSSLERGLAWMLGT